MASDLPKASFKARWATGTLFRLAGDTCPDQPAPFRRCSRNQAICQKSIIYQVAPITLNLASSGLRLRLGVLCPANVRLFRNILRTAYMIAIILVRVATRLRKLQAKFSMWADRRSTSDWFVDALLSPDQPRRLKYIEDHWHASTSARSS